MNEETVSKVHFSETCAYKYITGIREPHGIRVDTGLYLRFKPVAKRVYGSVCRAVEIYMIALIETVEKGVHFSNTDKPIHIEKIVIERNLRPRRKLIVKEEVEVCGFRGCDEPAVAYGLWLPRREKFFLCEKHLLQAKSTSRQWKILDHLFSSKSEKRREDS